ncbi:MAG: hypothetical protein R3320_04625 [Nitriliruptorales bacterium]|nr:hypothetical protein [Nitriliruptorales bacterium]
MSARVNLLPREIEERNVARRRAVGLGIGVLVLIGLLVLAYLFQLSRVGDAEDRLAAKQAEVDELRQELGQLVEFQELEQRSETAADLLQVALGDEVSFAGMLQDLAAVFPTDSEVRSLNASIQEQPVIQLGATRVPIGTLNFSGASVNDHAPGLERLMLELGKVAAFSNVYFSSSVAQEDSSVVNFTIEIDLGPELRTLRYVDGLPEELR